jgi:hypothetical protein
VIPPWFRALVVVQLAGVCVLVALAIHIAVPGGHSSGRVVPWGNPPAPQPTLDPPRIPTPASMAPSLPDVRDVAHGLLSRLNHDTATLAAGEYALLVQLESVIRDQITDLATHPPRGG